MSEASIESSFILRAVAYYTDELEMFCESCCCKEVQVNDTKSDRRWRDYYYKGQLGIYDVGGSEKKNWFK